MRLKQLLGVLIATLLCGAWAAASAPQLTNVSVVAQGNVTTVTMHATGIFRHNEYRANDGLLLVDLAGVSAGQMHERERAFNMPGLKSYRVVGYKGMGNVEVARLEVRLNPGTEVKIRDVRGGVAIDVMANEPAPGNTAQPGELAEAAKPSAATRTDAQPIRQDQPEVARVQQISVSRGEQQMVVEVTGTRAMRAHVMKLTSPDRIVMDIENAVPAGRPRPILVNAGGLKAVRMARFQAEPPVTRIVVDALSAQDFNLSAVGNRLVLKLHPASEPQQPAKADANPEQMATSAGAVAVVKPATKQDDVVSSARMDGQKAAVVPAVAKKVAPAPTPVVFSQPIQEHPTNPATAAEGIAVAQPAAKTPKGDAESPAAQQLVMVEPTYAPRAEATTNQSPAPQTQSSISQVQSATEQDKASSQRPVNFALEQQQKNPEKAVQQTRYSGEPISVNLKDVDLKDFFRLIHEISGLNVVLDPGVAGTLTLVLDDVPWDQALEIVLKNNGLDKQLEGNVLRIATIDDLRKEAQARRLQQEAQALAVEKVNVTRFLSYAQAKDVLPTVKKLLSARGDIVADTRTNGLVIQDIPSVIPEVDRLLAQLDRKTQEVEIEARVVAATRTFLRDIGTQLGFGWGNGVSAVGGVRAVGDSPMVDTVPTRPLYFLNEDRQVPLFSNLAPTGPTSGLSFLNATNAYRVDMILSMAESRGLLKILSRPRVVTQNNKEALVKQGFRIPVVTMGQLGGPPSVTYLEAVLRLTVTPQITVENTIFLNVDIENTTPDFSRQILGNPVFLTQQATTQVLVTDGGTVLIGGVIQTQNSVNVQQVPLLGNVPVLGNLFKHKSVQNSTQELIFILTPKIVQT